MVLPHGIPHSFTSYCRSYLKCATGPANRLLGITGKKPEGRKKLGFVKIDVADVVENRRITDTWSLMDSEQGEIQLKLEWMPLQLADV